MMNNFKLVSIAIIIFNINIVYAVCLDPNACNFDPELGCTDDDGSCFYSDIVLEYETSNVSCVTACDGEIQLEILNFEKIFSRISYRDENPKFVHAFCCHHQQCS